MVNLRSGPRPPSFLFICDQARWVNSLSVDDWEISLRYLFQKIRTVLTTMISVLMALKASIALLKARISVGQTTS